MYIIFSTYIHNIFITDKKYLPKFILGKHTHNAPIIENTDRDVQVQ